MWICKKCHKEVKDNLEICWNCGSEIDVKTISINEEKITQKNISKNIDDNPQTIISIQEKSNYPFLIFFSKLIFFIATFIFIAIIIFIIMALSSYTIWNEFKVHLFSACFSVLCLFAISAVINLLIDIESNTRKLSNELKSKL